MTIGRILFDNMFRDDDRLTYAYSGSEVTGFEKENAIDWRDFSLFRTDTGATELSATFSSDQVIDTFSWYVALAAVGDIFTMVLRYESTPAFFTDLASFNTNSDPAIGMETFDAVTLLAGRILRIDIQADNPEDIRQIAAGERLDFPIGQHQGIAPPNLRGEFVMSNVIGVNGSFLGRDKVRADLQGDIELEFVQPQAWVRDEWVPFMEHAERFAFFYAWNLDDFADEVVFAWARSTPRPSNTGPNNKMTTSLPWSALAT